MAFWLFYNRWNTGLLLNQRLLDMTHYIKSFIAATMDEGKKWMIISGGGGKAGGLKVDTNTGSNPFAGLQFARLYFDGFSSIEMDKRRIAYRSRVWEQTIPSP